MATAKLNIEMEKQVIAAKARGKSPKNAQAGRFGVYGGRYVPETLMAALDELERAYDKARRDPKFQKRLDRAAADLCRTSHAAVLRAAPDRKTGRREDLSQARRPAAHRRAQDQQLHRPGTAGRAHGQDIA